MKTTNFANFAAAVLIGLAIGIPANAPADDTEIYTGENLLDGIKPNVIFILDTSGSMGSFDGEPTDRLDRMKEALFTLLDNVDNVNIGLMRFHTPGGPILFPVSAVDADASEIEAGAGGAGGVGGASGATHRCGHCRRHRCRAPAPGAGAGRRGAGALALSFNLHQYPRALRATPPPCPFETAFTVCFIYKFR